MRILKNQSMIYAQLSNSYKKKKLRSGSTRAFLRSSLGFSIDFFARAYFTAKKAVSITLSTNSDVNSCVHSRDNGLDMSNMHSGFLSLIPLIARMILPVKDDTFQSSPSST